MPNTTSHNILEFKGLGDWFEIFEGGQQTDSKGKVVNLSEADLDTIVANSNGNDAPLVCGHPKHNAPAYGWSNEFKRDGLKLLARAHSFADEFSTAVANKHFPERSVSLEKTDNGYRVRHIGFLGAVPPAVKTLSGIEFNDDDTGTVFEFAMSESERNEISWFANRVASLARAFRDFLIDSKSIDDADRVIPGHMVSSLEAAAHDIRNPNNPTFSATESNLENEETGMPDPVNFTQDDMQKKDDEIKALQAKLDAQAKKEKALSFAAAKTEAKNTLDALVKEGRLLPAQIKGEQLSEFMAQLKTDEGATLEFSEGDNTVKKSLYDAFVEFLDGMGKQIMLGKDTTTPNDPPTGHRDFYGHEVDAERLDFMQKAQALAADKNISFADAVQQLTIEQES